jgi:D-alanyl-D-alanine carboxypeptidase
MSTRIFSSRAFTRDVAAAKAAALPGSVLITHRGEPVLDTNVISELTRSLKSRAGRRSEGLAIADRTGPIGHRQQEHSHRIAGRHRRHGG